AQMGELDQFLRDIWLECCDHLSAFDDDEVDMEDRVGNIISKGTKLSYDYDFGSTTHLIVKGVGEREGLIVNPGEVRLLARTDPPDIPCGRRRKSPATIIDMENAYDESGWLCARCAEKTGLSEEEMTLPVVNSPRTGVCGYTGN